METFAEPHKIINFVIPAKTGIQFFQALSGFRVKPGMTEKGIMQRSRIKTDSQVTPEQTSKLLPLLPSGPDGVHNTPFPGTWLSFRA